MILRSETYSLSVFDETGVSRFKAVSQFFAHLTLMQTTLLTKVTDAISRKCNANKSNNDKSFEEQHNVLAKIIQTGKIVIASTIFLYYIIKVRV